MATTAPAITTAHHDSLFIGGTWRRPAAEASRELINPATDEPVASIALAGAPEVDAAVRAARDAQPAWAALGATGRAAHLAAIRDGLAARQEEVAAAITAEMGCPARTA